MKPSPRQRSLLLGFIGSISLCALVGIYCLLLGSWGQMQVRVLGTTATIAGASILALGAAVPWERRLWHPLGPCGATASGVALLLSLIGIWYSRHLGDEFYKTMAIAWVLAVALPHVGLLALARVRISFRFVRPATVVAIAMLAILIIVMILFEQDDDALVRIAGVLSILSAAGTIAVPVLHRISAIPAPDEEAEWDATAAEVSLTCPRCATTLHLPHGRSRCATCGLKILLEFEEWE